MRDKRIRLGTHNQVALAQWVREFMPHLSPRDVETIMRVILEFATSPLMRLQRKEP